MPISLPLPALTLVVLSAQHGAAVVTKAPKGSANVTASLAGTAIVRSHD